MRALLDSPATVAAICPNACRRRLLNPGTLFSWIVLSLAGCSSGESAASNERREVAPDGSVKPSAAAPLPTASTVTGQETQRRCEILDLPEAEKYSQTIEEQRASMILRMQAVLGINAEQADKVRAILGASPRVGQGNPKVTNYAMTRRECLRRRQDACVEEQPVARCGGRHLVPLYNPNQGQTAADARVCIDAYEFPGVPCDYPLTWASPRQAVQLCEALGKRLCDAHEWEGACAGALRPPEEEYDFSGSRATSTRNRNRTRDIVWSYGPKKDHSKCGTGSRQSKGCTDSQHRTCGSNTYPAGSFPACRSPLGVYDLHGNAAEHMNFPRKVEELGSRGGHGFTEMKGSWFLFQQHEAHLDDCRWRAPAWHESRLLAENGHGNYHLGFRCCKDIAP